MKRFVFRLERVREMRAMQERLAGEALARHLVLQQKIAAALRDSEALRERWANEIATRQAGSFRPAEQEFFWQTLQYQQAICRGLTGKLNTARAEAEQARLAVVAARQKHEALVRLRSAQLEVHQRELARADELMIDDYVASQRARRQLEEAA